MTTSAPIVPAQLELPAITKPEYTAAQSIADRFEAFHAANPHVFDAIVELAWELRDAGLRKASMKLIFEQLRWRYLIQTKGDDFVLNNNYTAHYARLVMERVPGLDGFFNTREHE